MNWPEGPPPSWVLWVESNCEPDDDLPVAREDFPDLMTSQQAAAYLGCSKLWVNELARKGRLEVVKVGRENRFHKVDLAVYLAETRRKDAED